MKKHENYIIEVVGEYGGRSSYVFECKGTNGKPDTFCTIYHSRRSTCTKYSTPEEAEKAISVLPKEWGKFIIKQVPNGFFKTNNYEK